MAPNSPVLMGVRALGGRELGGTWERALLNLLVFNLTLKYSDVPSEQRQLGPIEKDMEQRQRHAQGIRSLFFFFF